MRTTYEIYRPGEGEPERGEVDWPRDPGYGTIKALVEPLFGGEPLEHVTVLHAGARRDMFVSEIGHQALTSREPLPINDAATAIYRNYRMTQHPDTDPKSLPDIAGPAVLFLRQVWF